MNKMRLSLAVVIILSSWAGSVPAMAGDEHSPDANVAVEQHESAPSISTQESGVDQRIIIDGIDLSEVVLQQDVIEVIAPTAQALPLPVKPNHVVIDMSMFDYCDELFYPEDRTAAPSLLSVDSTFVKSILNFKEVVCPMTKRKAAMWLGFAALGGGIAALETTVGFSEYIMQAVQYNSTALMAVIYGLEPLFSLFDLAVAKYPEAGKLPDPAVGTPGAEEIALVIPAHNSAGIIKKTLKAALKHLKPEQIFVVDNGSGEMPSDNTADKIKAVNPGIHYIYQAIPNKTIAQYAGTMAASKLGYKYIMTTDDDVRLPENFDFCTNRINDEVKAVCFPIRAVSPDGKPSILVNWQDVEYQASDLAKLAEDRFGVTQYPHGAGSLWETDT
ncbi:MAG: glycosyltransferase, partial [Bdellovibrionia bacterium]